MRISLSRGVGLPQHPLSLRSLRGRMLGWIKDVVQRKKALGRDQGPSKCTRGTSALVMPEQCKQKDYREGDAEHPKQCASSKTHDFLLCFPSNLRTSR
jgi:hypothetical protein